MTLDMFGVLLVLGTFIGLVIYFYFLLTWQGGKTVKKDTPFMYCAKCAKREEK